MKTEQFKQRYLLIILFLFFPFCVTHAQYVTIPDANFRGYLQQQFPGCFNANGQMDTTCQAVMTQSFMSVAYKNIADLEGVQYFDMLNNLNCSHNQLTSLPPLPSTINQLDCGYNQISGFSALPASLLTINAEYNSLTTLPATLPPSLSNIQIEHNQLTSLPTLPANLAFLKCGYNQITSLPALPSSLFHLRCEFNQITAFPALPNSLYYLSFFNNQVPSTAIPANLPTNLYLFDGSNNPLTVFPNFSNCPGIQVIVLSGTQIPSIPSLPSTLTDFRCNANQLISSVPTLPSGLEILDVSWCNFNTLPALPNGLVALNCAYNPLTSFPAVLPDSLASLACDSTYITSLPALPVNLYFLSCTWNSGLSCLPLLPPGLQSLTCFNTPINCLPNHPPLLTSISPGSLTVCTATSSCALYPEISGKVFSDTNNNGVQDAGEAPIVQKLIAVQPNNWFAYTGINGEYALRVETNVNYSVTTAPVLYYTTNPSSYPVTFTAMAQIDSLNNFGLYPTPNVNDLRITLTSGTARPGFDMSYWITYENVGTTTLSGDASLAFDNTILTYLNSSISPTSQTSNTITWSFTNLPPFGKQDLWIDFNVGATTPLGTALNASATIQPITGDVLPSDNTNNDNRAVQGSYDPNEKIVSEIILSPAEVAAEKMLEYIIFFQNTGTDTAFTVKLIDTLSQNLQIASLEVLSASHPYSLAMSEHGTLHIHFANILLPDSNVNEPASHGFIRYRIRPKTALLPGDEIQNKTDIYFDYNLPITTNTTITTVSTTESIEPEWASTVKLYPNPVEDKMVVSISGMDNLLSKIRIFTTTSQELTEALPIEASTNNMIMADLSRLPEGVYFIQIYTEKGILNRKIVIR